MSTVVKLVGKRVDNTCIEEIKAYIKVCTQLSHSVKQILTELREVYGSYNIPYEIVCRWRKIFCIGTESVNDATYKIMMTGNCNRHDQYLKVREIIESDGRYTIRDITKAVGISLLRVHFILKRVLKV